MIGDAISLEMLQAVADASLDGVMAFDRDGCLIYWNRAMERMTGVSRSQVVDRKVLEAVLKA